MNKYLKQFLTLSPTRVKGADKKTSIVLSLGIVLTQLGDFLSTKIGLVGGAVEQNGTMARFIGEYGFTNFLYLKLAASLFLVWTCWKRPLMASTLVILYLAVILNNLFVISRHVG